MSFKPPNGMYFLILVAVMASAHQHNNKGSQEAGSQNIVKVQLGNELLLKCFSHKRHANITWEFQRFDIWHNSLKCDQPSLENDKLDKPKWTKLDNKTSNKLKFARALPKNDGLYRCRENNKVKKTFTVEVTGLSVRTEPKVESLIAHNLTGPDTTNFTLQCKVTSELPPDVFWFKICNVSKCSIHCQNHCLCLINTSHSKEFLENNNTYLSKMYIMNAQSWHSGVYFCSALSYYGEDHHNITIEVPQQLFLVEQSSTSLLFLIPLCFAVIPIIILLCYYRKKRRKKEVPQTDKDSLGSEFRRFVPFQNSRV